MPRDRNLRNGKVMTVMISFLEMVQQYPIGSKIELPREGRKTEKQQEVVGYEYYSGTGYLVFGNQERVDVERIISASRPYLH